MSLPTERNGKVINCVLPKGTSSKVLQALYDKGFTRVNFAYARGFDIHDEPNVKTGLPNYVEKEMLTIIAKDEAEGELLFDLVYDIADIGCLGGGMMYMSRLSGAVAFMLPNIDASSMANPASSGSSSSGSSNTSSTPPAMAAKPK